MFWEAFTGGDIAYTGDHHALEPGTPAYTAYLAGAADSLDRDRPRLQVIHNTISQLIGENLGPLTWTPRQRRTCPTDTYGVEILLDREPGRNWPGHSPF